MIKLLVQKFNLRYEGKNYKAGEVVDLPDDLAKKLVAESPAEFKLVKVAETEKVTKKFTEEPAKKETVETAEECDIYSMNVKQLKKYCKDNGIDFGSANTRADLVKIIEDIEEPEIDELPGADLEAVVK